MSLALHTAFASGYFASLNTPLLTGVKPLKTGFTFSIGTLILTFTHTRRVVKHGYASWEVPSAVYSH